MAASVGVCRPPVSRLFDSGGLPIAVRVLIADAARDASGPVLVGTRVTRLKVAALGPPVRRRPRRPASIRRRPINIGAAKSRRPRDAMRPARGDRSKNSLQAFRAAAALFRQRRPRNPAVRVIVH